MRYGGLLLLCLPLAVHAQQRACAIQGAVLDAQNGSAIAKAKIFATLETDNEGGPPPVRRITDASGQFCFEHLDAGEYRVQAERFGYLDASYGQQRPGALSMTLEVERGKALEPVVIKMTRQAVITGILLDAEGDPIPRTPVRLVKRTWAQGKMFPANVAQADTDDQGRFRLSQIAPGTYYLSARPSMNPIGWISDVLDAEGHVVHEQQVETFYKDSLSLAGATPVAVKAGQELDGLVLTREKIAGHRLSGRIPPDFTGGDMVRVQAVDGTTRFFTIRIQKDGSFHSDALPPARYSLTLETESKELRGEADLTGGDADGVVLEPVDLLNFEATVRVEGATTNSKQAAVEEVFLEGNGTVGYRGEPQGDGRFKFEAVRPGLYHVYVQHQNGFVKRIAVNGELQDPHEIDLTRGKPRSMEIVLSARFGTLQVQVTGTRSDAPGITLLLERGKNGDGDIQMKMAAPDGRTEWKSLEPGKYRLYAFEYFDEGPWGNPDLVSAFQSKSIEIDLHEDEHARAKLPLISAEEFQKALQRLGY
jgi:hypothetical protein